MASPTSSHAGATVTVTRSIAAPADQVWSMISDITRMSEWSPETASCEWLKGATGPAVGNSFRGNNARDGKTWKTRSIVSTYDPGNRSIAFDTVAGPLKVSRWSYSVADTGSADAPQCEVTESWHDQRGWLVDKVGALTTGVTDRRAHNRAGMDATLAALAAAAEA